MQLLTVLMLFPGIAAATGNMPCTFIVGHGTQVADSTASPGAVKPDWFVVTGRAEVEVKGTTLTARFFDSRLAGDLSHTLKAKLSRGVQPGKDYQVTVSATLKTMHTDSGDDALSGSMVIAKDNESASRGVWQSLVVQNSNSFVGIACYAKSAA
jgi:hypothetical protein